ncbi:MAG: hypothetical protein RLZZ187_3690, partial [Pseudomonadota bacterium]
MTDRQDKTSYSPSAHMADEELPRDGAPDCPADTRSEEADSSSGASRAHVGSWLARHHQRVAAGVAAATGSLLPALAAAALPSGFTAVSEIRGASSWEVRDGRLIVRMANGSVREFAAGQWAAGTQPGEIGVLTELVAVPTGGGAAAGGGMAGTAGLVAVLAGAGLAVGALAGGGGGGGGTAPQPAPTPAPAPTFDVVPSAGGTVISFTGTATGNIEGTVAGGVTTFTRGGISRTVTDLFSKTINVASGQTVVLSVTDPGGAVVPAVGGGVIAATGPGNLVIKGTDAGTGVVTSGALNVSIALSGGSLTFDLTNDNQDTLTVTGSIDLGGGALIVSDGLVNVTNVTLSNVGSLTLNSEFVVTLAQFAALGGTYAGSGILTIDPSAADLASASALSGVANGAIKSLVVSVAEFQTLFGNPPEAGKLAKLASTATVRLTDTSVNAATIASILAIDAVVAGTINMVAAASISGAVADVRAIIESGGIVTSTSYAATLTGGSVSVADANFVAADTTGVVTATITQQDAATLATLTETGNAYTITVTGTATAAQLNTINAATTVQVAATGVTAITGTFAEFTTLLTARAASPSEITLASNFTATVTGGSISVANANALDAATAGVVTAEITETTMTALNGLAPSDLPPGAVNAYTIRVTDASVDAAALNTLDGKTTVTINATSVVTLTGSAAAVADAISANGIDTAANVAVILDSSPATAIALNRIDQNTSAWVDASAVTIVTGTIADALFALDARGLNLTPNVAVQVPDTAIGAAALRALDAKTTGVTTLTGATSVSGVYEDVHAVLTAPSTAITGWSNPAVTVQGLVTAAQASTLAGLTTGVVTATITPGMAASINTDLTPTNASSTDQLTITLTDEVVEATALSGLNGKTGVDVNASSVGTVTGTVAQLQAAYATGVAGLGNEAITVTGGAISVTDANTVAALTSGVVTATISDGGLTALAGLAETGNAYAITVTDTQGVSASALAALSADTTRGFQTTAAGGFDGNETITLTDATVAAADANTAAGATTDVVTARIAAGVAQTILDALGNASSTDQLTITLTDEVVEATALSGLNGKTGVDVNASSVGTVTGTVAQLQAAYATGVAGLGNEAITVTGGAISVTDANTVAALTSGVVTATVNAAGANATDLDTLAANASRLSGTITGLELAIPAAPDAAVGRIDQFKADNAPTGLTNTEAQALFNKAPAVTITGTADADWIDLRSFSTNGVNFTINGGNGNNVIYSGNGNDTITTGSGNDYIEVGGGRDTVNAGTGDDIIAARSLHTVDGSVYNGGDDIDGNGNDGVDTLRLYGTHDLTGSTLISIDTMEMEPGSPSKVFMTINQVRSLGTYKGTPGNSELVIVADVAPVTIANGQTLASDGNQDTLDFRFNGTNYTATIPANTNTTSTTALQAAVDAATRSGGTLGSGQIVVSFSGNSLVLTPANAVTEGVGTTLTNVSYQPGAGGGAVTGTSTPNTNAVLTSIVFDNLQKLTLDKGITASLSLDQLIEIGEVSSGDDALTVGINGVPLNGNVDISEAELAVLSRTINISQMNGFTLTMSQEQAAAARVQGAVDNKGTVRIVVTGATLDTNGLGLADDGAPAPSLTDVIESTHNTVVVVVNPANANGVLDINGALTGVKRYDILAGKTLLITGTEAAGLAFTGAGTIAVDGDQNYNTPNTTFAEGVRFEVRAGGTLTLTADQASGRTIVPDGNTGTRTVNIVDANPSTAYDFSGIVGNGLTTTLTFTANGQLNAGTVEDWGTVDTVQVATGRTLTLTAAQATNKTIQGVGTGSIEVSLDNTAFNFSNVSVQAGGSFTAIVTSNVTLNSSAALGSLTVTVNGTNNTLTLSAAQASGKTITGDGNVAVTALDATAAANLSTITNTGTKTAAVSEDVTFTGNLGTFTTTVAATKTLTAAAAVVSGKTITGDGNVAVTALDATPAANLSTITNTGTKTAAVSENVTFEGNLGSFTT